MTPQLVRKVRISLSDFRFHLLHMSAGWWSRILYWYRMGQFYLCIWYARIIDSSSPLFISHRRCLSSDTVDRYCKRFHFNFFGS